MENASKALIIAAAVLITIILVSLGMLLISNVSGQSEEAKKVGDAISSAMGEAVLKLSTSRLADVGKVGEPVNYHFDERSVSNIEGDNYIFTPNYSSNSWEIFKIEGGCVYLISTSYMGEFNIRYQ